MRNRKRRNLLIGILGVMLVFLGIGYAVLSSTLTITSASNVTGNWNVKLTSISVANKNGTAESNKAEINSDGLGATVSNVFYAPGDSITYEVKVENKGSIDAIINIDLPDNDSYYLFSTTFANDTSLKTNNEYTFQITITYDEDAEGIPTGNSTHEFNIEAVQDDESGSGSNTNIHLVDEDADIDDIGTEIVIGTEHFFVISHDNTANTITMLAKWNLFVGNIVDSADQLIDTLEDGEDEGYGLQSETAKGYVDGDDEYIGTVAFSSTNYWVDGEEILLSKYIPYSSTESYPSYVYDSNSTIYSYLDDYRETLNDLYELSLSESDVRLIKKEEISDLKTDKYPDWVFNTSYWTGSASDSAKVYYGVANDRLTIRSYSSKKRAGIRPVITISKDLIDM